MRVVNVDDLKREIIPSRVLETDDWLVFLYFRFGKFSCPAACKIALMRPKILVQTAMRHELVSSWLRPFVLIKQLPPSPTRRLSFGQLFPPRVRVLDS